MDGAHDLGGMHGFGAIDRSQEAHFAHPWEERVFRLTLACGMLGRWNLDQSRFARERMDPAHYLSSTYYEHWLHGLESLLLESGLVSPEEMESGQAEGEGTCEPVPVERIAGLLRQGGPTRMKPAGPPRFGVGDRVTIVNEHPRHHTRMPRYIRGRSGEIISHHGAHVFPDVHADSGERVPQHLYGVRFSGESLWGASSCEPRTVVCVDVFEPYISGTA
jgi:nitrile hydratase